MDPARAEPACVKSLRSKTSMQIEQCGVIMRKVGSCLQGARKGGGGLVRLLDGFVSPWSGYPTEVGKGAMGDGKTQFLGG